MSTKRYWLARDGNGMLWLFAKKPTWDATLKEWGVDGQSVYLGRTHGLLGWLKAGQSVPLTFDEALLIQGDAT